MAGSCGAFCSFCGKCGRRVTKVFDATKVPSIAPPGTPTGIFHKPADDAAEPEGEPVVPFEGDKPGIAAQRHSGDEKPSF